MSTFGKSLRVRSPVGPVFRVDGAKVRKVDPDGIGGWHKAVYPKLVPGNEIWIEKLAGGADEERKILAHEMIEIALMRTRGWTYQRAHDTANRSERRLRNGDCPLKVFVAVLKRHFPRRYQPYAVETAEGMYRAYKAYR